MPKTLPILVDIGQGMSIMLGLPTIESWDIAGRPKNARAGTFGFNFQTNHLEFWDGTSWYQASMSED